MKSRKMAQRIVLEVAGWTLIVVGIAALVLPGPGLLMLFGGLAILSQQYEWAERRLRPIEIMAIRSAAESVQTWPRIAASVTGALTLSAFGALWIVRPDAPGWWPLRESWWLVGGLGTGLTLIASSLIALATIAYSFKRFRGVEDIEAEARRAAESN